MNELVNLPFWNPPKIPITILYDLVCCLVHEIASYLMRFLSEFGKRIFENDCMSIKGYLNLEHNLKERNTKKLTRFEILALYNSNVWVP